MPPPPLATGKTLVLVLLQLFACLASAQLPESAPIARALAEIDGRKTPLRISRHRVEVEIAGQLARTVVEQVFHNVASRPEKRELEIELPAGADLAGFALWHGGEWVEALVLERPRAREEFEEFAERNETRGLLEQTGPQQFTMSLGEIFAGGTVRVRTTYTEVLFAAGGGWAYRHPMGAPALLEHPLDELTFDLHLRTDADAAACEIACSEGDAVITRDASLAHVHLSRTEVVRAEDIVVTVTGNVPILRALACEQDGLGYVALLFAPPLDEGGTLEIDEVTVEGAQSAAWYPATLPAVKAGEQVLLVGRFAPRRDGPQEFTVHVSGASDGESTRHGATLIAPTADDPGNPMVPRLWTAARIRALAPGLADAGVRAEVVALARDIGIATAVTSFVVVTDESRRRQLELTRPRRRADLDALFALSDVERLTLSAQCTARNWRERLRARLIAEIWELGRAPALSCADQVRLYGSFWLPRTEDHRGVMGIVPEWGDWLAEHPWQASRRIAEDADDDEAAFAEEATRIVPAEQPWEESLDSSLDRRVHGMGGSAIGCMVGGRWTIRWGDSEYGRGYLDVYLPEGEDSDLSLSVFPRPVDTGPIIDHERPSLWSEEAWELAQRIAPKSRQARGDRPVKLEIAGDCTADPERRERLLLLGGDAWMEEEGGLLRWSNGEAIGALDAARGLAARERIQEGQCVWLWEFLDDAGFPDLYRDHGSAQASVRPGDNPALRVLVFESEWGTDRETLDTERGILVRRELRDAAGELRSVTTFSDFVEAGGNWWATKTVERDASGSLRRSWTLRVTGLSRGEFDAEFQARLAAAHDPGTVVLDLPLPTLAEAEQAQVMGGDAVTIGAHLRFAAHHEGMERHGLAWRSLALAEELAGERLGAKWLRADRLARSRQTHELEVLLESLANDTSGRPVDVRAAAARAILEFARWSDRSSWSSGSSRSDLRVTRACLHRLQSLLAPALAGGEPGESDGDGEADEGATPDPAPPTGPGAPLPPGTLAERLAGTFDQHERDVLHGQILGELPEGAEPRVAYRLAWIAEGPSEQWLRSRSGRAEPREPFAGLLPGLRACDRGVEADRICAEWFDRARAERSPLSEEWQCIQSALEDTLGRLAVAEAQEVDLIARPLLAWLDTFLAEPRRHRSWNWIGGLLGDSRLALAASYRALRQEWLADLAAGGERIHPDNCTEVVELEKLGEQTTQMAKDVGAALVTRWERLPAGEVRSTLGYALRHMRSAAPAAYDLWLQLVIALGEAYRSDDAWFELVERWWSPPVSPATPAERWALIASGPVAGRGRLTRFDNRRHAVAALLGFVDTWTGDRSVLVEFLRARLDSCEPVLRLWVESELLALRVRAADGDPAALSQATRELLGSSRDAQVDAALRPLLVWLQERSLTTLAYLALRPDAQPELATRLATELRDDLAGLGNSVDARYHLARLLLVLEREPELGATVDRWSADLDRNDAADRWSVLRAMQLAEGGQFPAAIALLEAVESRGSLTPIEYRMLSLWYEVIGRAVAADRARVATYLVSPGRYRSDVLDNDWGVEEASGRADRELSAARRAQGIVGLGHEMPRDRIAATQSITVEAWLRSVVDGLVWTSPGCADSPLWKVRTSDYDSDYWWQEHENADVAVEAYAQVEAARDVLAQLEDETPEAAPGAALVGALLDEIAQPAAGNPGGGPHERALRLLALIAQDRAVTLGVEIRSPVDPAQVLAQLAASTAWLDGERGLVARIIGELAALKAPPLHAQTLDLLFAFQSAVEPDADEQLQITAALAHLVADDPERAIPLLRERLERLATAAGNVPISPSELAAVRQLALLYRDHDDVNAAHELIGRTVERATRNLLAEERSFERASPRATVAALFELQAEIDPARARGAFDRFRADVSPGVLAASQDDHDTAEAVRLLVRTAGETLQSPGEAYALVIDAMEGWAKELPDGGSTPWTMLGNEAVYWRERAGEPAALEDRFLAQLREEIRLWLVQNEGSFKHRDSNRESLWSTLAAELLPVAADVLDRYSGVGEIVERTAVFVRILDGAPAALAILSAARDRKILSPGGVRTLAELLMAAARPADARPLLEELHAASPADEDRLSELLACLDQLGEREQLQRVLAPALERFVDDGANTADTLAELATWSSTAGLHEAAATLNERLAELHERGVLGDYFDSETDLPQVWARAARARAQLDQPAAAIHAAYRMVGATRVGSDERDEALGRVPQILATIPSLAAFVAADNAATSAPALDTALMRREVGRVLLEAGEPHAARGQLRRALELQPNDPEAAALLQRAADASGR